MIIRNEVQVSRDLFHNSAWPLFDAAKIGNPKPTIPVLGMLSFISIGLQWPQNIQLLYDACVAQSMPVIFDSPAILNLYKTWLFVAHSSWQPKTSVVMYKKLSHSLPKNQFNFTHELPFESDQGVRFAGISRVDEEHLTGSVWFPKEYASAVILSSREDFSSDDSLRMIFTAAFQGASGRPNSNINWAALASALCSLGDIVVRSIDDREQNQVSIDFIMLQDKMELLQQA